MPCRKPGGSTSMRASLPYLAQTFHVEQVLAAQGFDAIDRIHVSVDPVSARNPGYHFVDFRDRATAEHALTSLRPALDGWLLKRWGDWHSHSRDDARPVTPIDSRGLESGPHGALNHFNDIIDHYTGRRLYVGGLGQMINQAQHNIEIALLFADFTPTAIGKRITPHKVLSSFTAITTTALWTLRPKRRRLRRGMHSLVDELKEEISK
ncbi:RNA recognition motif domain protein [Penicillium capsulatum]|uniref:RNA recognition motif domain protein n=1 Tax=Penicillium capsulatum TaxID=69766 RepID=A0A9W9ISF8_9EURO|nr:RNA recognition motif domain protein [Penicillium capsulatum]KAJ6130170.1 RNA recognition motif domain protein [Penicillium capsulatum]